MAEAIHLLLLLATFAGRVGRRQARDAYAIEENGIFVGQVLGSIPSANTTLFKGLRVRLFSPDTSILQFNYSSDLSHGDALVSRAGLEGL